MNELEKKDFFNKISEVLFESNLDINGKVNDKEFNKFLEKVKYKTKDGVIEKDYWINLFKNLLTNKNLKKLENFLMSKNILIFNFDEIYKDYKENSEEKNTKKTINNYLFSKKMTNEKEFEIDYFKKNKLLLQFYLNFYISSINHVINISFKNNSNSKEVDFFKDIDNILIATKQLKNDSNLFAYSIEEKDIFLKKIYVYRQILNIKFDKEDEKATTNYHLNIEEIYKKIQKKNQEHFFYPNIDILFSIFSLRNEEIENNLNLLRSKILHIFKKITNSFEQNEEEESLVKILETFFSFIKYYYKFSKQNEDVKNDEKNKSKKEDINKIDNQTKTKLAFINLFINTASLFYDLSFKKISFYNYYLINWKNIENKNNSNSNDVLNVFDIQKIQYFQDEIRHNFLIDDKKIDEYINYLKDIIIFLKDKNKKINLINFLFEQKDLYLNFNNWNQYILLSEPNNNKRKNKKYSYSKDDDIKDYDWSKTKDYRDKKFPPYYPNEKYIGQEVRLDVLIKNTFIQKQFDSFSKKLNLTFENKIILKEFVIFFNYIELIITTLVKSIKNYETSILNLKNSFYLNINFDKLLRQNQDSRDKKIDVSLIDNKIYLRIPFKDKNKKDIYKTKRKELEKEVESYLKTGKMDYKNTLYKNEIFKNKPLLLFYKDPIENTKFIKKTLKIITNPKDIIKNEFYEIENKIKLSLTNDFEKKVNLIPKDKTFVFVKYKLTSENKNQQDFDFDSQNNRILELLKKDILDSFNKENFQKDKYFFKEYQKNSKAILKKINYLSITDIFKRNYNNKLFLINFGLLKNKKYYFLTLNKNQFNYVIKKFTNEKIIKKIDIDDKNKLVNRIIDFIKIFSKKDTKNSIETIISDYFNNFPKPGLSKLINNLGKFLKNTPLLEDFSWNKIYFSFKSIDDVFNLLKNKKLNFIEEIIKKSLLDYKNKNFNLNDFNDISISWSFKENNLFRYKGNFIDYQKLNNEFKNYFENFIFKWIEEELIVKNIFTNNKNYEPFIFYYKINKINKTKNIEKKILSVKNWII